MWQTRCWALQTHPSPEEPLVPESDREKRREPHKQKKYSRHRCSSGDGGDASGALMGELRGQGSPLEGGDI